MRAPRQFQQYFAIALSLAAVFWTSALLFVALRPVHRVPPVLGAAVHRVGALVCHQRPERSFLSNGRPFAVCARCTGLYLSGALGALIGWIGLARTPRHIRRMLVVAALPTAATVAVEGVGLNGLSNPIRAVAGLPLGATAGWLFVHMLRAEGRASTCAMIA